MPRSTPRPFAGRFLGLVGAVAGLLGGWAIAARADNPLVGAQLTSVFPSGGKQGTTLNVTLGGIDLDDATTLVFSHPGLSAVRKAAASQLESNPAALPEPKFAVTVSGAVPPGLYEVRAAGPSGISNPRTFVVGTLNEVVDANPPERLSAAREVPLESTINGAVRPERADFFKFAAKRGQRVLLETWARRIDSRLDPRLVLYDAAGHELTRAKERFHRDPLLDFIVPEDGSYVVKLYDFLYRGGPDYFYRLSLSTAPRLDFVMPPSGLAGSKAKYTLYGRNLPGGAASGEQTGSGTPLERLDVEIELPANSAAVQRFGGDAFGEPTEFAQDAFAYRLPTPRGETNPVNIYFATGPVVRGQTPNHTPAQARRIPLPCEVVGQFNPRGEQDWYQFDAHKGDAWTIEVFSQRMGLSTDPFLLVQRVNHAAGGREEMVDVAESDDPPADARYNPAETFLHLEYNDPIIRFVAPQDGTYRILVRDLYGQSRGSPEYVYRLSIRRPAPDFRLMLLEEPPRESDNNSRMNLWSAVVHKGGSTAVTALAQRIDGFAGEIQLSVEGLPEGITCPGATIGPGADLASLVFVASDKLAPWNGSLRVVAKARIGDRELLHDVRTATSVWPIPQLSQEAAQFRLAPQFAIAAAGDSMPQIKIAFGDGKRLETAPGASLKIPVKVVRGEKIKGLLQCRLAGACRGMSAPELDIPADGTEGIFLLNVNSLLPVGSYTLPLRAYATINCRPRPEAAEAATAIFKSLEKISDNLWTITRQTEEAKKTARQRTLEAEAAVRQALEVLTVADRAFQESQQRAKQVADALAVIEEASAVAAVRLHAAEAAQATVDKAASDTRQPGDQPKKGPEKQPGKLLDKIPAVVMAQADAAAATRKARDESHQTDMLRDAARPVAQVAATQRLNAEATKAAAQRKAADAAALVKTNAALQTAAENAAAVAAAKSRAADAEKTAADKRARLVNVSRDYTLVYYSNPLLLQVDAAPISISVLAPLQPARPGGKFELPLQFERRFGFTGIVTASLVLPPGLSGLHAGDVSIPAGQNKGKLAVDVAPQIKPGDYNVAVRARMTFNGQASQIDQPVVIQVQAPPEKKK